MNILTFDIEEWILYDNYKKGGKSYFIPILEKYLNQILDLLDAHNQSATFFCLGQLAKEYPAVIKKIIERGHDIGCHSNSHNWITTMNPDTFFNDTKTALQKLEDVCSKKIISYRAPAFSITEKNKWAFEILTDLGIEFDSSIFPATRSFGGFPSLNTSTPFVLKYNGKTIKEFPINTVKILGKKIAYSGGGYFRLIPYSYIKKWTEKSPYTMSYFHLRDFDSEQKHVYSLRYFKSYYGIKNAFNKFQKYLNDFRFLNLEQAGNLIEWEKIPFIEL